MFFISEPGIPFPPNTFRRTFFGRSQSRSPCRFLFESPHGPHSAYLISTSAPLDLSIHSMRPIACTRPQTPLLRIHAWLVLHSCFQLVALVIQLLRQYKGNRQQQKELQDQRIATWFQANRSHPAANLPQGPLETFDRHLQLRCGPQFR